MKRFLRILAVDDDPLIRELIGIVLSRAGHCVETARDGLEGLEKVLAKIDAYDLVITDVMMPTLTGIALLKQLRAANYPGKVLVWAGTLNPEVRRVLGELRVDGLLVKPAMADALLSAVEQVTSHPGPAN
jgi:DNA-binding response OmpR family regulator